MLDIVCIAPGRRSTPLIKAFVQRAKKTYVHFDERGLAFFALGLAKAKKTPVALVTTSGTAVGNLLPAIMEAHHSHIPLIVITADRPLSEHHVSSNQTTDQLKCFQNYVVFSACLNAEDPTLPHLLAQAYAHAKRGPIHLNLFIDNPNTSLVPDITPPFATLDIPTTHYTCPISLDTYEKGLILAGKETNTLQALTWANALGWPLITDILSGIRHYTPGSPIIRYHEQFDLPPVDALLHLGGSCVSGRLLTYLQHCRPHLYLQVAPELFNPHHCVTHHIPLSPQQLRLSPRPTKKRDWLEYWRSLDRTAPTSDIFDENSFFAQLHTDLPLFIGNSLPIRAADAFFFPPKPASIAANRGLSGIDGNIATACGLVHATGKPLIACIGDQAFLHDLNSVALMKNLPAPLFLVVFNNGGGQIFQSFEIQGYARYFINPHEMTFEGIASCFSVPYARSREMPQIGEESQTTIIELNLQGAAIAG